MPTGHHEGPVHCKKCNGKAFPTISALRKHQWKEHIETFATLMEASKTANNHKKAKEAIVKITAEQLLERLKIQKQFMIDIVDMIEGIINK